MQEPGQDRPVTIDSETATETVTSQEDVDRIRREAGLEEGTPPPRDLPSSGTTSDGEDTEGDHDHTIDRALQARDEPQPG